MTCLGSIPRIVEILTTIPPEDESLQILHKLFYKLPGRPEFIKANLLQFNGFVNEQAKADFKKNLSSLNDAEIRSVAYLLALPDVAIDDLIVRIGTFISAFQVNYLIEDEADGSISITPIPPRSTKRDKIKLELQRLDLQRKLLQYELDCSSTDGENCTDDSDAVM